ncbi:hypothetical protein GQ457_04G008110 [Hibiscus cannabinus]
MSGHKVSCAKTHVCFPSNCLLEVRASIVEDFSLEAVEELRMYLGVPLLHNRGTKATYAFIIDKKQARLIGWATKSLSLVGRINLVKAAIEKIIRRFVWGSTDDEISIAFVPWEVMQSLIDDEGLGFKDVYQRNRAFLMKISYQLVMVIDNLWVRVLRAKYKIEEVLSISLHCKVCSRLWKGLSNIWDELKESISLNIRGGQHTDFWYDNWLGSYE